LSDGIRAGIWALARCQKEAADKASVLNSVPVQVVDRAVSGDATTPDASSRKTDAEESAQRAEIPAADRLASARNVFDKMSSIVQPAIAVDVAPASHAVEKGINPASQASTVVCPVSAEQFVRGERHAVNRKAMVENPPPSVRSSSAKHSFPKHAVSRVRPYTYARPRLIAERACPRMMLPSPPPVRMYLPAPATFSTCQFPPFGFAPRPYHWFPPPGGYWRQ
jgi:hypothetical protein